jgi:hypothetical protein
MMPLSNSKFHDDGFIGCPALFTWINECVYFAHLLSCLGKILHKRDAVSGVTHFCVSCKSVQGKLYFSYEHKLKQ